MARIDHIGIYVKDLEKAKAFFETYFEAKAGALYHNQRTGFKSYFLTMEGDARIEIMTRAEESGENALGSSHLSIGVGSKEAVDALASRLQTAGHTIVSGPRTTGDGYYECCIKALDNNLIEITE